MEFRRIIDLFDYQQAVTPQKTALSCKQEQHRATYSTKDCITAINRFSAGLLDLGVKRGDKIALIGYHASPQWIFLDYGIQQIGGIVVSLAPFLQPKDLEFIFNDAAIRYCIVADRELWDKIAGFSKSCLSLKSVYTLKRQPGIPGPEKLMIEPTSKHMEALQGYRATIHEDDLAIIIYSNFGEQLKGIKLSHKNVISGIRALQSVFFFGTQKKAFSYLPLSYLPERLFLYASISQGTSINFVEGNDTLLANLQEARPQYFVAVPDFLEDLLDHILKEQEGRSTLLNWAILLGQRFREDHRFSVSYWFKRMVADILIYRKWRKLLGKNIEAISIIAPYFHTKLAKLFSAAGMPVREGFYFPESTQPIAWNLFSHSGLLFGTSGPIFPGYDFKLDAPSLAETGEILLHGPSLMMGYYGKKTRIEGWLRTGILGKIREDHFLEPRGLKKDVFQLTNGMTIIPYVTETAILQSPFIRQCIVFGEAKPYPTALIVPFFSYLKLWCHNKNIPWTSEKEMIFEEPIKKYYADIIGKINAELNVHYRLTRFSLIADKWSISTGEITPDYLLNRSYIHEKYRTDIEGMYEEG